MSRARAQGLAPPGCSACRATTGSRLPSPRARQGADYVAFGSAFASPIKPTAVHAPLELYREAKARLAIPVVAIGGITPENALAVIDAGADAIAVITALFDAPDVRAARAPVFTQPFHPKRGYEQERQPFRRALKVHPRRGQFSRCARFAP